MKQLLCGLIWCAVAVAAAPALAQPDDRSRAAEHFALAQSAEARKDWRTAIVEYQQAYQLSPHPAVLYNIGFDYERLGDGRNAVIYFLRYLDDKPDADDRDKVMRRIESLRTRPSEVSFRANPDGATILVDGRPVGTAPLTVALDAGSHQVVAESGGQRSSVRQIALEYGDSLEVSIDLYARPGLLTVAVTPPGAEVRIDGSPVGLSPWSGEVAAGAHQVLISKAGYQSLQRPVTVPAQGSAQVRDTLVVVPGATPDKPVEVAASGKVMLSTAYGFNSGGGGVRYTFGAGYRSASNRLEASLLLGFLGTDLGGGFGAESRLFLGTGRVRPYVRGAAFKASNIDTLAVEGGAGIVVTAATPGGEQTARRFAYEYFLEVDVLVSDTGAEDSTVSGNGTGPLTVAAATVPFVVGLNLRFGGP